MITLTRDDRIALERACEARIAELIESTPHSDLLVRDSDGTLTVTTRRKDFLDERARLETIRRHLACGEPLEIP